MLARLLAGIGTGSLTGAANVALLRFGPRDGGKRAALSATLSFTAGLALAPCSAGWRCSRISTRPRCRFADPGDGGLRHRGLVLSWPKGVRATEAAPSGQGGGSLGGAQGHGAGFFLCALALFTAWAVAASLLAMGPKVVSEMLGMTDLGLFGYLVAAYLVFSGLCQLWARRLDARHTLQSGVLALALCVLLFAGAVHGLPSWLAGLGLLVAGYAQGPCSWAVRP